MILFCGIITVDQHTIYEVGSYCHCTQKKSVSCFAHDCVHDFNTSLLFSHLRWSYINLVTAFERQEILLSIFASIWNHKTVVSVQEYDSVVALVIFVIFFCGEPQFFSNH